MIPKADVLRDACRLFVNNARAEEIIAEAIENSVDEDIACQRTRRSDCRASKAASGIKVDEAVAAIGDEDDDDHNEAAP